jgi:hypothetical protein
MAAHLESELTAAIESTLPRLTQDQRYELFEQDGPLATFARKIAMASALGIIGPKAKENFRLIQHVRNAFAHHRIPIEFSTPEVHAVCMDMVPLELPPFQTAVSYGKEQEARGRFETQVRGHFQRAVSVHTEGSEPRYPGRATLGQVRDHQGYGWHHALHSCVRKTSRANKQRMGANPYNARDLGDVHGSPKTVSLCVYSGV